MNATRRRVRAVLGLPLLLALALLAACGQEPPPAPRYHCPMHPTYVSDRPGECPVCHMALVAIEGSGDARASGPHTPPGFGVVHASPKAIQLAGVRTEVAVVDTVAATIRAVGVVRVDETRVRQVNTRVSGWVDSLAVGFAGQFVREGDPLLTIYSPELVASQEEYLNARKALPRLERSVLPEVRNGARELMESARSRLLLLGAPESLLRGIEISGTPQHEVVLEAPATGYVTGKDILAGARIEPGMLLYTIADLSHVWVEADIYEFEASRVLRGADAVITLPYDPSFRRTAPVAYVYPTVDPETRTLRVRLELPNSDLALRPEMFADVSIRSGSRRGVTIPADAVLDSGMRKLVFVETGPGTFEPREVTTGISGNGRVEVASGVEAGEKVVVKANFLLDSESRLKSALADLGAEAAQGDSR